MELYVAKTMEQYVESARGILGLTRFPVLGPNLSDSVRSLVDDFNIEVHVIDKPITTFPRLHIVRTRYAVLYRADDPWRSLAEFWAYVKKADLLTSESLIEAFEDLKHRALEHVAIVAQPETLTAQVVAKLQAYNTETWLSNNHTRIGFMTARTAQGLTELFFKTWFYQHHRLSSGITLTRKKGRTVDSQSNCTTYTDKIKTSQLRNILQDRREYFNIYTEAWEDHFFTGDGFICPGIGGLDKEEPITHKVPSCAYTSECYDLSRNILPTHAIRTKVMFANACTNLRFTNGLFESSYGLMQGFLEGSACAYVGSNITKWAMDDENLLFKYLYEQGFSLGYVVDALNRNCYMRGLETMNYVVVGDPEIRISNPEVVPNKVKPTLEKISSDELEITLFDVDLQTVEFEFVDRDIWNLIKRRCIEVGVLCNKQEVDEVFYDLCPGSDGCTITCRLFAWNSIKAERVTVLFQRPMVPEVLSWMISPSRDNLAALPDFQINIQKVKSLRREVESNMKNLLKLDMTGRYNAALLSKKRTRVRKIEAMLDTCDRELMDYLVRSTETPSYNFPDSYYSSYRLSHVKSEDACPQCHDAYYVYHFYNLYRTGWYRLKSLCPVCGEIADRPDDRLEGVIIASEILHRNIESNITLQITNKTNDRLNLKAAMAFVDGTRFQIQRNVRGPQVLTIGPRTRCQLSFHACPTSNTPTHLVYGRVYILQNSAIYLFSKPFWVSP